MNKKTLNIISVCIFVLIVTFSVTQKDKLNLNKYSNNIIVDENGKIKTKADVYRDNILETVSEENIKNFKKFSKTFEKNSNDNLTDGISKDIFAQYIKYNTSGEIKESDIINTTQDMLKNKVDLENPIYYKDIQTVASNINNLKTYGNNVAIIQNGVAKGIVSIVNKKNKTPYIANIYKTAAKLLMQIEVPDAISREHLALINGYNKYSEGLLMLEYQDIDPAKSLLGLTKIKSATEEILGSFDKIKKTIILNKVNYTENEPGIIWLMDDKDNTSIKLE